MVWTVVAASSPGAVHGNRQAPNQDAERHLVEDGLAVVAVADGHGHARHFRSHHGAALAVEVAVAESGRWLASLGPAGLDALAAPGPHEALETGPAGAGGSLAGAGGPLGGAGVQLAGAGAVAASARRHLLPAIVDAWRAAVAAHAAANPWGAGGEQLPSPAPASAEIAYGATLLLAVTGRRLALLAQIGDGDIVTVGAGGGVACPVPTDPLLDGHLTTSLAQPDALASFRVAALDLASEPLSLVLVATDGYGNAQRDSPWAPQVGADLRRMAAEHGVDWLAERLPGWVARCASGDGSGDDTTVALLVAVAAPDDLGAGRVA